MVKTIRVSDEFHEAHSREGETMEETLRRVRVGPTRPFSRSLSGPTRG